MNVTKGKRRQEGTVVDKELEGFQEEVVEAIKVCLIRGITPEDLKRMTLQDILDVQ